MSVWLYILKVRIDNAQFDIIIVDITLLFIYFPLLFMQCIINVNTLNLNQRINLNKWRQ